MHGEVKPVWEDEKNKEGDGDTRHSKAAQTQHGTHAADYDPGGTGHAGGSAVAFSRRSVTANS